MRMSGGLGHRQHGREAGVAALEDRAPFGACAPAEDLRQLRLQSMALRRAVGDVHASEALIDYVQALLTRSRQQPGVRVGLSPRAGIALLRAAKAYALLLGRHHVLPDDVQALFAAVATHRLVPEAEAASAAALAKAILHAVPVD